MGIFSSLKKIIKPVAQVAGLATGQPWLTAAATAMDVGGTLFGAKESRKAATDAYGRSMEASNTAYQRAVTDMRAANLNPILAYSQGGASAPTAQVADTSAYKSLGDRGMRTLANLSTAAQIKNTEQQTSLSSSQETLTKFDSMYRAEQARRAAMENDAFEKLSPRARALVNLNGATGKSIGAIDMLLDGLDGNRKKPRGDTIHVLPWRD